MCTSTTCDRPDPAEHLVPQGHTTAYMRVHQRLRRTRGPASAQPCAAGCGKAAKEWAYHGPQTPGNWRPYSTDLSQYAPLCVPCHKRHDQAAMAAG